MKVCKVLSVLVLLSLFAGGCYVAEFARPEFPPYNDKIISGYYATDLKQSNAADVLGTLQIPDAELLSQSTSVVASAGTKKDGYKQWFKMVAFDEDTLTAQRKYFFMIDERPKSLFVEPWEALRFDCRCVIPDDVLEEPYGDPSSRRIAILKTILEQFRNDKAQVAQDNQVIDTSAMMVNQAMESALLKFDESPAAAMNLHDPNGVEFPHINLDKGEINMEVDDETQIANLRILAGSAAKFWKVTFEQDY